MELGQTDSGLTEEILKCQTEQFYTNSKAIGALRRGVTRSTFA